MNVPKILDELRDERARIDVAIRSMEQLAAAGPKRRGRPPNWLREAQNGKPAPPKKRGA